MSFFIVSVKYFFCVVLLLLCEFQVSAQVENINSLRNNTLNIAVTGVNGDSRKSHLSVEKAFLKENPGISVNFMVYEAEHFKKNISTLLTEKNTVDVVFLQAGERLFTYVRQGLILPITDVWQHNNYNEKFPKSLVSGVKIDDEAYAIPIVYSMWGMFYNSKKNGTE
jgi:ABC-type glycerol-3-phosphate transport system substrate-binding protein